MISVLGNPQSQVHRTEHTVPGEIRCKDMAAGFEKRIKSLEERQERKCEKEEVIKIVQYESIKNTECEREEVRKFILQELTKNTQSKEEVRDIVQEKITRNKVSMPEGSEGVDNKDNVQSVISELNERKNGENNIVMYGIDEQNSMNRAERLNHDKEKAIKVGEICGVKVTNEDIIKIIRLGKNDKLIEKPKRPMIVTFADKQMKIEYLKGGSKL
ncbi:hypothetical protein DPMN_106431 [Dreissena polymorpha]|uniref:Uncharacterized protein n=1 Tax=Dreissena polymorpha TaxID=45954 RepID=A0A9D4QJR6_DREPO|nr:hypothetical protein DPMN_106431 [Dreissena polymorpha]